jgi:hypothetical protein
MLVTSAAAGDPSFTMVDMNNVTGFTYATVVHLWLVDLAATSTGHQGAGYFTTRSSIDCRIYLFLVASLYVRLILGSTVTVM